VRVISASVEGTLNINNQQQGKPARFTSKGARKMKARKYLQGHSGILWLLATSARR
jgi:hypothetical protein